MQRRLAIQGGLSAVLAAAAVRRAGAQTAPWPTAPVRLVVPFPPGGPTDIFARRYAHRASALLPQPMVVDNRPGGGGTLGTTQVARARPDGHTLVFGSSSTHVTGPLLITPQPYDPVQDFALLSVGIVPMVLAVNAALPARSLDELVAMIRSAPGRYTYSSSGPGSINHLGGELFRQLGGGLDVVHVPYRGNAPALQAAMTGEVQFLLDTFGTALPHHRSGAIRILAVCAERRSPVASDIPTAAEAGMPGLLVATLNLVAAPAATPPEVVEAIAMVTRRIMRDETLQQELLGLGIEPIADADPQASAALYAREIARWQPIIESSGARAG